VLRRFAIAVAAILAVQGSARGAVNIWLSGVGSASVGSAFPTSTGELPVFEPFVGTVQTVYIWGRPDAGKSLENLSLNLVAATLPVAEAIVFTNVTLYNDPFPASSTRRFEYVDDSSASPPLPIEPNRIDGIEGLRIFGGASYVGIGSGADPDYSAVNSAWLIGEVSYIVFPTGVGTVTQLFLEVGAIGLNHTGEATTAADVILGHATEEPLNAHDDRGVQSSVYDAVILPRFVPGDANGDLTVDQFDYQVWRRRFGSTSLLTADHNRNGIVDAPDYTIWRNNLGFSVGGEAASAVPEPSCASLIAIAVTAILAVRRWTAAKS
jgi:hypothetical protein